MTQKAKVKRTKTIINYFLLHHISNNHLCRLRYTNFLTFQAMFENIHKFSRAFFQNKQNDRRKDGEKFTVF